MLGVRCWVLGVRYWVRVLGVRVRMMYTPEPVISHPLPLVSPTNKPPVKDKSVTCALCSAGKFTFRLRTGACRLTPSTP